VLQAVPGQERYRTAGRTAELVAARARVSSPLERSWERLDELDMELQDWRLDTGGRP